MNGRKGLVTTLLLALGLAGCVPGSGLKYSLDTPPLILVPASLTGVKDARGTFRDNFCAIMDDHGAQLQHPRNCEHALHRLNGEETESKTATLSPNGLDFANIRLVIVPGVFGECVARYAKPFSNSGVHLRAQHGLSSIEWMPVSGRSSSTSNAKQIAKWFKEHPTTTGKKLVVIGYSKGVSDLIEAIQLYPNLLPKEFGLVTVLCRSLES